jgi:hypothetical protein
MTKEWSTIKVDSIISLSDSTTKTSYCKDCGESIEKCVGYKCWV